MGDLYDSRVFWCFSEVLFPGSSFPPFPPLLLVHCIGLGLLSPLDTLLWAGGSRRLCATTRVVALQSVDIGRVWFCFCLLRCSFLLHLLFVPAAGGLYYRRQISLPIILYLLKALCFAIWGESAY